MTRRVLTLTTATLLLTLTACGSSPSTGSAPTPAAAGRPPTPAASAGPSDTADQTIGITVTGGKVTSPTGRVAVKLGSRLRITVTADVTDEVHVHVYNLTAEVSPGTPASITFVADKPGQLEVELEKAQLTLVHLIVS